MENTNIIIIPKLNTADQYYTILNLLSNTRNDIIIAMNDNIPTFYDGHYFSGKTDTFKQVDDIQIYSVQAWKDIPKEETLDGSICIVINDGTVEQAIADPAFTHRRPAVVVSTSHKIDIDVIRNGTWFIGMGDHGTTSDPYYMYVLVSKQAGGFDVSCLHSHEWMEVTNKVSAASNALLDSYPVYPTQPAS